MSKVNKKSMAGIEIYDYTEDNYMTVMCYDKWRVAFLNYGDRVDVKNFHKMERHLETDEVFVLLEGEATLIIGEELQKIEMEAHKVYNVPKGVWHHIFMKKGSKVLIVENENTGEKNSEYMSI